MAGFDVSRIIAAHAAGQQVRQSREAQERDKIEHDLKVKEAKLNLDTLKLQQAQMQHQAGMADVSAASGKQSVFPGFQASATPGGEVQDSASPTPVQGPPASISDLLMQNRPAAPLYSAPIGGVDSTQTVLPEAISVPSSFPGGAPTSIRPKTKEEQDAEKLQQLIDQRSVMPPVFAPAGSQPFIPSPTGGYVKSGTPVPKADNPANYQRVLGKLNGIPVTAGWSPDDNTYHVGGIDVTQQFIPDKPPVQPIAKPGSYSPVFDSRGEIIGKFDSESGDITPLNPEGYRKTALSPDRQKMEENAKSGLRVIKDLREEIKKPGVLAALSIPGSPSARKARAARAEMIDVMTRLRTGAALNKDEQAFYRDQAPGLIDALFSDPATIEYKLRIFENEFKGLAGEPSAAAPSSGGWKIIGVK